MVAVSPWKSTAGVAAMEMPSSEFTTSEYPNDDSEAEELPPLRPKHRPASRAQRPTQNGLENAETAIERLEPLLPLALVLHGVALLSIYDTPKWLFGVMACVTLFSVYDIAWNIPRRQNSLKLRAGMIIVAGGICLMATGGASSPFFVWLVVSVCVYSLLLPQTLSIVNVLGVLSIYSLAQYLTDVSLPLLEFLTRIALLAFLGLLMQALGVRLKSFEYFRKLANIDSLTQVSTRRRFFEHAEREFAHCFQYGHRITVMVFDLDGFKEINDTHGHAIGDEILRRFGKTLRRYARPTDVVGRLGGDEFALFMPNTGIRGANDFLRRLRGRLSTRPIETSDGQSVFVQTSAGVAVMNSEIKNLEDLMELADRDLYRQKLAGNRREGLVSKKMLRPRVV